MRSIFALMLAARGPSATNFSHVIASFELGPISACPFIDLHLSTFTPCGVSYSLPLHCEQYRSGIRSLLLIFHTSFLILCGI